MHPEFLGELIERMGGPFPMGVPSTVEELRAIVALNVMRERERCAKIADRFSGNCSELTAQIIADKIRKGE